MTLQRRILANGRDHIFGHCLMVRDQNGPGRLHYRVDRWLRSTLAMASLRR